MTFREWLTDPRSHRGKGRSPQQWDLINDATADRGWDGVTALSLSLRIACLDGAPGAQEALQSIYPAYADHCEEVDGYRPVLDWLDQAVSPSRHYAKR